MTVTTVGYGDRYPKHVAGRVVGIVVMLSEVGGATGQQEDDVGVRRVHEAGR